MEILRDQRSRAPRILGDAYHSVFASRFSATVTVAYDSNSPQMTANSYSLSWALLLLLLGGCATGGQPLSDQRGLDPLERSNRAVFAFNQRIDRVLFKPAAEIYKEQLPPALRVGVSNFFS